MNKEENIEGLTYQIPRNVIARFEILPGIGWKQLIFGGGSFLIVVGFWKLALIINMPLPIRLFLAILLFGGPIFISIPNPSLGNISLLDRIIKAYRFSRSQKRYFFRKEGI